MTWIVRVNAGLKLRAEGEKQIADALRERLDKVGEAKWLKECESEWGWSRSTAYRHLNPDQMEAARVATQEARANVPTVGTSPRSVLVTIEEPKPITYAVRMVKPEHTPECTRQSSSGKTPSDQDGNGGSIPALPLQSSDPLPAHWGANRNPPPRKDGQPDRRFIVNGGSPSHGLLTPKDPRRALDLALDSLQTRWIADVEAGQEFLTPKKVEILSDLWERLGAVIERWGAEGGESLNENLAGLTVVDGGRS